VCNIFRNMATLRMMIVFTFALHIHQVVFCDIEELELMKIQTFLNCFNKICTQYFSEELLTSLPPYHGQNLRFSGEGQNRSLLQETRNLGSILLEELGTSSQLSVFVYRGPDEGSFQTQVEEMHHRPSSCIIYFQTMLSVI
jgi:hypothetical protein